MDITPLIPKGRQLIEAYGDGGFRITGQAHAGSVLLLPDHTATWPVAKFDAASVESLLPILATEGEEKPEIVIMGCGATFAMIPKAIREAFRARGMVIEAMDTGAACRTYNILVTEGRRVAAALIAV